MEALIQQMKDLVEQQEVPDTVEGQQNGSEISDSFSSEVEVLKESMISLHLQCSNIKTQVCR